MFETTKPSWFSQENDPLTVEFHIISLQTYKREDIIGSQK